MSQQTIGLGAAANDGTGDTLRAGGTKINANFTELYAILSDKAANTVYGGPTTGAAAAPTFRALVAADIPSLAASKITSGTVATARLGSGTANNTTFLRGDQTWQVVASGSDALGFGFEFTLSTGGVSTGEVSLSTGHVVASKTDRLGAALPDLSLAAVFPSGGIALLWKKSSPGTVLAVLAFAAGAVSDTGSAFDVNPTTTSGGVGGASAGDVMVLQLCPSGPTGATGDGVPAGGTTGQVLAKTDNMTGRAWVTPVAPAGGTGAVQTTDGSGALTNSGATSDTAGNVVVNTLTLDGTSGKTLVVTNAVSPPTPQGVIALPLSAFGAGAINQVLGTPDAWELVNVGGTNYKKPLYL